MHTVFRYGTGSELTGLLVANLLDVNSLTGLVLTLHPVNRSELVVQTEHCHLLLAHDLVMVSLAVLGPCLIVEVGLDERLEVDGVGVNHSVGSGHGDHTMSLGIGQSLAKLLTINTIEGGVEVVLANLTVVLLDECTLVKDFVGLIVSKSYEGVLGRCERSIVGSNRGVAYMSLESDKRQLLAIRGVVFIIIPHVVVFHGIGAVFLPPALVHTHELIHVIHLERYTQNTILNLVKTTGLELRLHRSNESFTCTGVNVSLISEEAELGTFEVGSGGIHVVAGNGTIGDDHAILGKLQMLGHSSGNSLPTLRSRNLVRESALSVFHIHERISPRHFDACKTFPIEVGLQHD